jgi:hypothetical protein
MPPDKHDLWRDPDVNDFDAIRDIFKSYDLKPDASVSSQQGTQQFEN